MKHFHVAIYYGSEKIRSEFMFDLSRDDVEQRFLNPYRNGRALAINGRSISTRDLDRIWISKTTESYRRIWPTVKQELEDDSRRKYREQLRRQGNTFIGRRPSGPRQVATREKYVGIMQKGKNVTNDLIMQPPGMVSNDSTPLAETERPPSSAREIFVVHGRNDTARKAIFDFLRAVGLHPLEWAEAVQGTGKPTPYIGEILDAAFSRVHAVLVLLTADDEARLRSPFRTPRDPVHEVELAGQARPNVLFEAGMAMGRDENRTILVELGTLRPFSDVAGRHVIRLDDSTQRRQELAHRLQAAGCPVNLDGTDWHTAGDFEAALEQSRSTDAQTSMHDQE